MMVSAGMWTLTGGAPDSHWHIERERYVRYSVTMQNMRGQALPRVELWICAPLREASTQQVRTMKSSPPCEEIRDSLGNHLLRFVFHNVAPFAVRIATVEATLELSPAPAGAQASRMVPPSAPYLSALLTMFSKTSQVML